ncbi:hypothetical protein FRAHR75_230024 [Frankia sp. Hr75.2]|nr:hypothetical protein FRAHR75_230024 [Frankia sp. Hr75.2]SQD97109.1 hypothetical protein FMEAI12_3940027 [Parafrankia sp. Ea1.12]
MLIFTLPVLIYVRLVGGGVAMPYRSPKSKEAPYLVLGKILR